ncbi:MAG: ATP-dependent helicase, partial [Candidatus Nomurabacteria bacterium]|jgi:DNA helicase-2/ATP-dependent DNA helicase PcrA|nr:ATP-dependent helicase [Candidatus Nomurabacteria bacterium]
MASIFGADAYKVAVHTFHSFGAEIIGRYAEYFYNGANFSPADNMATTEILQEILEELPHDNPLSKKMNGDFTYLGDIKSSISDFRRAGLMPSELRQILQQNLKFAADILPDFRKTFENKITKNTLILAEDLLSTAEKIAKKQEKFSFATEPTLAENFEQNLKLALAESAELDGKTTPITKFKNDWVTVDDEKNLILKDAKNSEKLLCAADVYEKYIAKLQEKNLYDFDDMIIKTVTAIEQNADLKFDLQERFQYILVDEFQDTNGAQMRLLHNLTDYEKPNIMVVGDDDQAIYKFQGADISNIQSFVRRYQGVTKFTLTENYRSGAKILTASENVSAQIDERLTKMIGVDKTLHPNVAESAKVEYLATETRTSENALIAEKIASEISRGVQPQNIAVIARKHAILEELLPFLAEKNIAVNYEREQSVLESAPVEQLVLLAKIVNAVAEQNFDLANELLPQLLAFEAWRISPLDIWNLSLAANRNKKFWLEEMLQAGAKLRELAEWLIMMSSRAQVEPLENILDELFGTVKSSLNNESVAFRSPLYEYFFSQTKLNQNPSEYLDFLSALTTLRQKLRDWRTDKKLLLADFVEFVQATVDAKERILSSQQVGSSNAVQLMSAHKAKGLEFDTVFVINATSQGWGVKAKNQGSKLSKPHNLQVRATGSNDDERLRLLFVAMTRAKHNLIITAAKQSDDGKELLPLEYLTDMENSKISVPSPDTKTKIQQTLTTWHQQLTTVNADLKTILQPKLERYKLSATHVNSFLDITNSGPEKFLLNNLLRFPMAKTPSLIFGTAIHVTLQRAHTHLLAKNAIKPLEDVLGDFTEVFGETGMTDRDHDFYHKKGIDALTAFYKNRIDSFNKNQRAEYGFEGENIVIGGAKLTGKLDLIEVDKDRKTVRVTDYKTGKPATSWQGKDDREKIKLRNYRQQLMFYKLLIENSREFSGWTVEQGVLEFVEPLTNGETARLTLDYDAEEMAEFQKLVAAVWNRIKNLDFPDTADFSLDFKGVIEFEKYLLQ